MSTIGGITTERDRARPAWLRAWDEVDWRLRDRASQAHTELLRRPANETYSLMRQMERQGLLDNYFSTCSDTQRQELLSHLGQGGLLEPQRAAGMTMWRDDASWPPSLREAVFDDNKQRVLEQYQQYAEAAAQWRARLARADSGAALRALGPPPPQPEVVRPPTEDPRRQDRWYSEVQRARPSELPLLLALEDRVRVLRGEAPVGLHLSVGWSSASQRSKDDPTVETARSRSVEVGQRGTIETRQSSHSSEFRDVDIGEGVTVGWNTSRVTATRVRDGVQSQEVTSRTTVELGPLSVHLSRKERGGQTAGLSVRPVDDGPVATVATNGMDQVACQVQWPVGEEKVSVGTGLRGLSSAEARRSLSPTTRPFFEDPPELTQGQPWPSLPESRRQELTTYFLWSAAEWEARRLR